MLKILRKAKPAVLLAAFILLPTVAEASSQVKLPCLQSMGQVARPYIEAALARKDRTVLCANALGVGEE